MKFLKDKILDLLALALVLAFYGGGAMVVFGLVLASWSLCGMGLALAAAVIVVIAAVRVMDDLRDIARHNALVRALPIGLRVVAEAIVCIFLYLVVMPVAVFIDGLMKGGKVSSMNG